MIPVFSPPWDSFVLTLPKFNVVGVVGVYISNGADTEGSSDHGGQKGGQKGDFTDTLQKLYRNLTETLQKPYRNLTETLQK